jgi:hypothetical protein
METREIMRAIRKLPVSKRMLIVEKTIKMIRENDTRGQMTKAADILFADYVNDKELTAFSAIDYERFYEAR